MSEASRKRLDHVVLPRRLAGLALLERYFPSPADNLLDAELRALAQPGDTVLDPWAGTGWTARRALARGARVVAAEPSPLAQLAARVFLFAPDPAALDAAFGQLAASRRVDVPLRQHIEELYATRCPTCRHHVVADQFVWPRAADAPQRKVYHCASCDLAIGGPPERSAPVDDIDLAKLGIEERTPPQPAPDATELPPADPLPPPRGDRPRFASTVHPQPVQAEPADARRGLHYQQLRDRFPVLDDHDELVDEILDLYTPRNLYALQAIANKIDAEFHEQPMAGVLRLALAACLLPASRLNGYPGRVASLRISGGHVRQPASRNQRETNVWQLFTTAVDEVRAALANAAADRPIARFAADFDELGGMTGANLLWVRCRPAVVGQYLPPESVDLVLGQAAPVPGIEELSFEYLATAWLMGREAAETLRLEPLFGSSGDRHGGADATALRHAIGSVAGTMRPGGWLSILLDGGDIEPMLTIAVAAAGADLQLADIVVRESRQSGDGMVLHFHKPSAEDRLRAVVAQTRPLRLGADDGRLTYPELAAAIERAAVALLRDRGEPAGLARISAAVLIELERTGLLRRLAAGRPDLPDAVDTGGQDAERQERLRRGGPSLLSGLLGEELSRAEHPSLLRMVESDGPMWWLREPQLADSPLADRVEWATFSILSTAGRLDERSFLERIFGLFPGPGSPDEELVRGCLAAYASVGDAGQLRTEDDLARLNSDRVRMIGLLADYGHRLGLRVWISKREQAQALDGGTLGDKLREEERRAYLPLVVRAPADALGAVDVIWYRRGSLAFLFEVEWTAMIGEVVLGRGRRIDPSNQQARFLVLPAERAELLRIKIDRSPWLRSELERQNWHVLKWQHFETLAGRRGANLDWLEPVLGLDPLIERGGDQLTMFGE